MFTWKRLLIAVFCLIVLLLAFTAFVLPGIVKTRAQEWVAVNTDRVLQIGDVSINPLTLVVEVRDLNLSEIDPERTFVSWKTLRVALSPQSLYHLAPVLREVRLTDPAIYLERFAANRFNFSDLLPAGQEQTETPEESTPVRFSLNNIILDNGRIELLDHSVSGDIRHTVEQLHLAVPFVGNLPFMVDDPVQPRFSAIINDSPLEMEGALKPFAETQEFSVQLELDDIDLPYYLAYLPFEVPVELRSGLLGVDLQLLYRAGARHAPELVLSGDITLRAVNLWDRRERQLLFLPLLRTVITPSRPLDLEFNLAAIDIYGLETHLDRDRDGILNFSRLVDSEASSPPSESSVASDTQRTPQLAIGKIRLHDGVLSFSDAMPPDGFEVTAHDINVTLTDLSLETGALAELDAGLITDRDEQLTVRGQLGLSPLTVMIAVNAANIRPQTYAPYYHEAYNGPLGGIVHTHAEIEVTPDHPLRVHSGTLAWHDASLAFNEKEGVRIDRIDLDNVSFDLAGNRLDVGALHTRNGRVELSRDPQGRWSFQSANIPALAGTTAPADVRVPPVREQPATAFRYRFGECVLENWQFDLRDRLPQTPARLQARQLNLRLENLAGPDTVESPVTFSTILNRTGKVDIKGALHLAEPAAKLDIRLGRIALSPLAPYIAEHVKLELHDGHLDARLRTSASLAAEELRMSFSGDVGISRFHLLDGTHHEDLLKWDSLQIAGIDGRWAPLDLTIDSITVSDYFAKVLIDEQARLNFVQVFQGENSEDATGADNAAASDPAATPATGTAEHIPPGKSQSIRINEVTLQGGEVDFTDRHLPNPFRADMRELGGSISGLDSNMSTRANVELRGKLRNQSPLLIEGAVNPLAEELFLDLTFNFSDIEMSPMSPYSGTYLGYLIEKGKLNLSLEYRVEDGALRASNEVFLDQFTFGEAVESDKATSLPVKLAVALLKDRSGEIHLDIPVSGNLDDPQFSIAGVVWTVIKNLLVKAATSPFALLGALVGGGDEDFSSVAFDAGRSGLSPSAKEKLTHMADALKKRPSLLLEVRGFVDPENDPEGYREAELERRIERVRNLDRGDREGTEKTGEDGDEDLSPEAYSEYLWQVYKQADFPRPRNFIGILKHLPDEELTKLLYTHMSVGNDELARLAQERARTVRDFLVEQGVPAERVFLSAPEITRAPEQENAIRSRVEFDISVK